MNSKSLGVAAMALLWGCIMMAGLWGLEAYKASARETSALAPHAVYPEFPVEGNSRGSSRLVMFLHPHCPCSRASLAELEEILRRCPSAQAEVILVKPSGTPPGWEKTDAERAALSLPRTRLTLDDGTLAQRLGAETSGHVFLIGADGRAYFSGGITRSRGHAGDSAGRRSILALLQGAVPETNSTPVFGCPLLSESACVARDNCCKSKEGSLP